MKQFVQDHLDDDPAQLLLGYLGKVDFDLKFAVQQINARQKVKSKVPSWYKNRNLIFPVSLSIEQASSELTGRYKVGLVSGGKMVDLTGGLGVDSYFLSQKFQTAVYCEQNKDLFDITKHNLKVLSPDKFEFVLGDSMTWFIQQQEVFDLVFIDPARRGEGNRKLYRLEDCEPDIVGQWDGLKSKSKAILVKASPMLDLKLALGSLQDLAKIMVLSVKNEVKEVLLFWSLESVGSSPRIEAVDIRNEASIAFSFTFEEEENSSNKIAEEVGQFLYEPNAAILKAGAFKIFGHRFGLGKIHPNSHFFYRK
ncbi:SAM-dependent methyltransferase [Indibacter alkaliphilus LW1]|uniref:SAM-dependent methyltransferase n=1 Tax=Indibacter alkaliphilus (strain CCUG 57479 / KCTC 22604 / LW1) TaxID=1189612 RepID=S2DG09_INDAL|nr:RsmD family RNA methyltransferase [Indibacter alkaliphilus]EOZ98032.1 SAM-dependent methyltransferase [Indibacter alkaliphilus LW1]